MSSFIVEGGHPLKGSITPQGAKNEALEVICATLLTTEEVVISNIPDIADVRNLISLLQDMGVAITHIDDNTVSFKAEEVNFDYVHSEEYKKKA